MRPVTGILLLAAALSTAPAYAAEPPARIVSINLCADELLIALADPGQIAGLSVYATDPRLSFTAEAAKAFRHDAASAETVIGLRPDLILAGRYTKLATRDMLGQLGYRVELIDAAKSVDETITLVRKVAGLVGHPERGEQLVAAIEAAKARAEAVAAASPVHPTAAVYQRRGYVTGGDTLTGELLSIAGFTNDGGPLAGKSGGFVPLEKLIADPPDYIVVAPSDDRSVDQGTALLSHPALVALYPPAKRIVLPENLTVCGGPSLPAALDWLAHEAVRVRAGS